MMNVKRPMSNGGWVHLKSPEHLHLTLDIEHLTFAPLLHRDFSGAGGAGAIAFTKPGGDDTLISFFHLLNLLQK